ncbi:MAG: DUF5996 family protein, partial [Cytophagaceae bacterium]
INHSWHVTLFVTPFGFTTGDLFVQGKHFQINLNFIRHQLEIKASDNEAKVFSLVSLSVAECYRNVMDSLQELDIDVKINPVPNEMENPYSLDEEVHNVYDPEIALAIHRALLNSNEIFTKFRAGFIGKCSPVHFFWGGFDLAVSRFSGRTAPEHPGGIPNMPDWVAQEAYSHEVCSCGFWLGNEMVPFALFYSYLYPEPNGFKTSAVKPDGAYYHEDLREFILPYESVRQAANPSKVLMDFLNSTYQAAADLAKWDRQNLESQKSKYSNYHLSSKS